MSDNIRVGIIGGAGYTAGELLRILLWHPAVTLVFVHSTSNAGKKITDIHKDIIGDTDMVFSSEYSSDCDVIFLCTAHGESKKIMEEQQFPSEVHIIDLSQDYRYGDNPDFLYGLPELYRDSIRGHTKHIANPGCFATALQLGLLPLASQQELCEYLSINAVTGSTGAGQSLSATSHYSWRANNMQVYKPFQHQHCREIRHSLEYLQKNTVPKIFFLPLRGNFPRGIYATIMMPTTMTHNQVYELFSAYYETHPFVHILPNSMPDMKMVVNTNKCVIGMEVYDGMLAIVSTIDNLCKGASGQAVQNMNLLFDLPETMGLHWKSLGL
jgi:N-acetyl-gamma-glutamyl-phosphate reductase